MLRKLCGESTLKNVILVTNMWSGGSHDTYEARENELFDKFFKPALDKGAQMVRHHDTITSAYDIIRRIMVNQPVALRIQRELADEERGTTDPVTGGFINRGFNEQTGRNLVGLRATQQDMERPSSRTDLKARPPR